MGYTTRLIRRRKQALAASTPKIDPLEASRQLAKAGRGHSFGKLTQLGFTVAAVKPVDATPSARALAEDLGIDLKLISGSGTGGRIIKRD
ncbi:MAG: E3 binding domain-containing protein, partial [Bacteroidota bacterium]